MQILQEEIKMQPTQQSNGSSLVTQGRIVWVSGDLFNGKVKINEQTRQPVLDESGQPVKEYGFGIAIPKVNPATGQWTEEYVKVYQALHKEALTLFPGGNIPPGFSMKFKDGDVDVDQKGVKYSEREGYAGHIVLACTTRIPIRYFIWEGGNNILVNQGIKCGDYVNVQLNIKAHPAVGQAKAGLYVNPSCVQFIRAGKEIINTPSGDQIFGMTAPAYAGQVVEAPAPVMPGMGAPQAAPAMPGYAPQAAPAYAQPAAPTAPQAAPAYAQPAAPAAPQVAPHYAVLPGQFQPGQPAAPVYAQPAAPAMPAMPGMPR